MLAMCQMHPVRHAAIHGLPHCGVQLCQAAYWAVMLNLHCAGLCSVTGYLTCTPQPLPGSSSSAQPAWHLMFCGGRPAAHLAHGGPYPVANQAMCGWKMG
jgi:hypothetical protein